MTKKLAALWIACWLLMQSGLAVAALYRPCCLADCDGLAAHCQMADCQACAVPTALPAAPKAAGFPPDATAPVIAVQPLRQRLSHAIWRPPCSAWSA